MTALEYLNKINHPLAIERRTEESAISDLIESHKHLREDKIKLRKDRDNLPRWKRIVAKWLKFTEYS